MLSRGCSAELREILARAASQQLSGCLTSAEQSHQCPEQEIFPESPLLSPHLEVSKGG